MARKRGFVLTSRLRNLYALIAFVIIIYGVYLIAEPSLSPGSQVLGAKVSANIENAGSTQIPLLDRLLEILSF